MYRDKKRYGQDPRIVVRSKPQTFYAPLNILKGPLVFTCSWSDFFIDVADPWRDEAWGIIRQTPYLTYQILTKRPERIANHLPPDWGNGWPNVWLGVSVENNAQLWRMDILRSIPAAIRFVSAEPLLEAITLNLEGFGWVISGGESGFGRDWRPANMEWFLKIRDQCQEAGVPFFHKQHGGNRKIDKVWGGRVLDGRTWDEMPAIPVASELQPCLLAANPDL
jgi:protein gp37